MVTAIEVLLVVNAIAMLVIEISIIVTLLKIRDGIFDLTNLISSKMFKIEIVKEEDKKDYGFIDKVFRWVKGGGKRDKKLRSNKVDKET